MICAGVSVWWRRAGKAESAWVARQSPVAGPVESGFDFAASLFSRGMCTQLSARHGARSLRFSLKRPPSQR